MQIALLILSVSLIPELELLPYSVKPNSSLAGIPQYSRLLLERDRRLSLTLDGVLRDVILADASNRGIDLAVRNVWSGYRPGPQRWQPSPHPNSHWLTCETAATGRMRSQIVHLNLLDGTLLVDGKPIDGLSHGIREQALYKRIFGNVCMYSSFFPTLSNVCKFLFAASLPCHSIRPPGNGFLYPSLDL